MKYELINKNPKADNIIQLVFENRNIKEENIFDYIECSKDFRTNPFDYINMKKAVDLLTKHIYKFSNIGILVDSDCDGYMSATMTHSIIKEIEPDIEVTFIIHEEKKHGLYEENMKKIKNMDIQLLIIPDASSNQVEEIKSIISSGIDVLVIDHHDAKPVDGLVIVNNQYNNINKGLSGGGMVLKFAEAMLGIKKSEKYTDLAAISIIADNMSMNILENRYYTKKGLQNINNKFIKKILTGVDNVSTSDVSFKISPLINAIVRMGSMSDKNILMKALIGEEGEVDLPTRKNGKKREMYSYADAAIKISKWRKDEQKEIVNEKVKTIEIEHDKPINIVEIDDNFNKNISGYLANVVSSKNLKPTLVLSYDEEEKCYAGSARSGQAVNFKDFLTSSGLIKCEGHQGAFGFSELKKENLNKLVDWIELNGLPTETVYKVDAEYDGYDVEKSDISAVNSLKNIWGKDIEEPLFAVKLKDASISLIGAQENTMQITKGGIKYIKFNCSEQEVEKIKSIKGMADINIIGAFDVNHFRGVDYHQLKIKDYEILEKNINYGLKINDCIIDEYADLF